MTAVSVRKCDVHVIDIMMRVMRGSWCQLAGRIMFVCPTSTSAFSYIGSPGSCEQLWQDLRYSVIVMNEHKISTQRLYCGACLTRQTEQVQTKSSLEAIVH